MNLNKANLAVAAAASIDLSRPNINSIHITDKFTEATNGPILARVSLPYQFDPGNVPFSCPTDKATEINPFIIPAKSAVTIKLPKHRTLPMCNDTLFVDVEKTNLSEGAYFNATDLTSMISPMIKKIDSDYPDIDQIVKIDDEVHFHTFLSVNYLQTLLNIAKIVGCEHVTIDGYDKPNKPVIIKGENIEGQEFYGMIMPCRED